MRKFILLLLLSLYINIANAQTLIHYDNDSTFFTEFRDGEEWGYIARNGSVVGITNKVVKDDYGKYYQLKIFINNISDKSYVFEPDTLSAELITKKNDTLVLKVYSYEKLQKKIKNQQAWAYALYGLSAGLNSASASYSTSYVPQRIGGNIYTVPVRRYDAAGAAVANAANTAQMMMLDDRMKNDLKVREEGYLKKNTIYSNDAIAGYMNIKYKKGDLLTVNIPLNDFVYSFQWDVRKQRKMEEAEEVDGVYGKSVSEDNK